MKKLILITLLFAIKIMFAQLQTPQPSPISKVEQMVGLTLVSLDYSRPSAKGRIVYGELVPYGKYWRTGANENTKITFSTDVTIGGKDVKKGTYALFTTPRADKWDIILYETTNNWGLPNNWDDSKVVLTTTAMPKSLYENTETFTIDFTNLSNDSAEVALSWEKTRVSFEVKVPTEKLAMTSIEKVLAGPAAGDFFSAASYYYQSNIENEKALTWVNKALELSPKDKDLPFWYLRLKSLIQARGGDKKGAIATAKESLANAVKAGNGDYERMNKASIAEWSK